VGNCSLTQILVKGSVGNWTTTVFAYADLQHLQAKDQTADAGDAELSPQSTEYSKQ